MASTTPSPPRSGIKERRGEEWGVVIKVKYGDTLKRFTAFVHQPTMIFEYDMNKLRSKISNLFMIDHDAVLILTYTDEDGDIVALDNDEELHDAVIYQKLNPLKIHVKLKPSSVSNSPSMSFPQLAAELNTVAKETLKSIPAPILGFLTNACHDVLQAASSSPAIAEVLKPLSNMHLVNVDTRTEHNVFLGPENRFPTTIPRINHAGSAPRDIQQMHEPDNLSQKSNPRSADAIQDPNTKQKSGNVRNDGIPVVAVEPHFTFPAEVMPSDLPSAPDFVHGSGHFDNANAFRGHRLQHPYGRFCSYDGRTSRAFHRGVICDGCGMHPIMGPRYKSTVKDNYDLCIACFHDLGNEVEYTRIDSCLRFPKVFKHHNKLRSRSRLLRPPVPRDGLSSLLPKLESRFLGDVTVWDGTVMPPSSHFTKIWRMHNNGTAAWPLGSQLVWVGGDNLGAHISSELEIPETGFPVDAELDIAVDCVAPSSPGHYRSYWQLALPSGQKFGEHVWVVIQVVDHQPASAYDFQAFLNPNTLPESSQTNHPFTIDVNSEPMDCIPAEPAPPASSLLELAKPVSHNTSIPTQQAGSSASQPSNDHPNSSPKDSQPCLIEIPASSSQDLYPLIEMPEDVIDIPSSSNPPENIHPPSDALIEENPVEQTLLRELEEMGFKQDDLNKQVLRRNQYDLERSLEDLCDYSEWDPLLNELQEMGFVDRELNKKLLSKNGGSIKRVVLDLISAEKVE
ncbi:hypothetical protein HPP92_024706 [Vanilla planifolia]|uniref:Protein NBR1 homolog n=1 Tax=Vanilla planifolia TaxID=51239 RepID=A0A835PPI4_VANPL|nr:hypothetical protein HPP92_024706 [Vanilla planifolia]